MLYILIIFTFLVVFYGLMRVWPALNHTAEEDINNDLWRRDPLSHPSIRRMSGREVADLPFDPREIASE